jgi:hypothetical protein
MSIATLDPTAGRLKLKIGERLVHNKHVKPGDDLKVILPGVKVVDDGDDEIPDYSLMGCLTTGDTLRLDAQDYSVVVKGEKQGSSAPISVSLSPGRIDAE